MRKIVILGLIFLKYGVLSAQVISGFKGKRFMVDGGLVINQTPGVSFLKPKLDLGISYITDNYSYFDIGIGLESNKYKSLGFGSGAYFGDGTTNVSGTDNDIKGNYIYNEFVFRVGRTWHSKNRGNLAPIGFNGGLGFYLKSVNVDYSRLVFQKTLLSSITKESESKYILFGLNVHLRQNIYLSESMILYLGFRSEIPTDLLLSLMGITSGAGDDNRDNSDFFIRESYLRNILHIQIGIKYAL